MTPDEYAAQLRRTRDLRYRQTRELKRVRGIPTSLLPPRDVRAHLQRLTSLGWSYRALEDMTGGAVSRVTLGNIVAGRFVNVERKTAAAVLAIPHTLAPAPRVTDTAHVPMLGAQRRIHALLRLGWTHHHMRALTGTDTTRIARADSSPISARRWRLVDALYQRHCMTLGPSTLTAARSRTAGLAGPLAWDDDIDRPDAKPVGHRAPEPMQEKTA